MRGKALRIAHEMVLTGWGASDCANACFSDSSIASIGTRISNLALRMAACENALSLPELIVTAAIPYF